MQILNFFLLFYPPCRLLAVDKQLNTKLGVGHSASPATTAKFSVSRYIPSSSLLRPLSALPPMDSGYLIPLLPSLFLGFETGYYSIAQGGIKFTI